ncbi:MAG: hypothetical protein DRR06_06735 [Gammaproteobacteria bacterium]|nr:MAG: hypothetical protein DRR06_06735 [Gammaproteobacteria bacterium]RLA53661.1 MAG: hypothetical protein DRR42_04140 [Gammaproteobacteria bacterium]
MAKLTSTAIVLSLAVGISMVQAEVIKLPIGAQAAQKQHLERPENGMTRGQVAARFGEPQSVVSSVGDPPISTWEYADYVVFFENDRVLHSVLKHVPLHPVTPDQ